MLLAIRRAYGFRTYEAAEIALYHALGSLSMPQGTRKTGESASSTTQTSFWYRENMGADGPKKYCEVSVSYRVSILKVSSNYPQILLRRQNSFQESTLE